jgi:hypothetical protein
MFSSPVTIDSLATHCLVADIPNRRALLALLGNKCLRRICNVQFFHVTTPCPTTVAYDGALNDTSRLQKLF